MKKFTIFVLLLCAAYAGTLQPEQLRVLKGSPLEEQYRDMLFDYLLGQARQATVRRLARLGSIRSERDLKTWQEDNRRKFLELIGGLPEEKTPLHPRLTGELRHDGYLLRKVIFESQPELYVTANLYVPTIGKAPFPAVLAPNGHSLNGKAYAEYQHLFIGLARHGYVVLTFDNVGQGERFQFWDYVFDHRRLADKSNEHGMMGIPEYLLGGNLAREMIWDGVRALDYLAGLPEVDGARIGVTGNSGGGTLSAYLAMLDPRIKAASIVTWVTSIPKKIEARENDCEADPEQDIMGLLGAGLDHTELVGMIAPRPVLIGAALRDFFPIEGTRQTFSELKEVYRKAGAPERVEMAAFDHEHYYSQPLREATTAWFDRWLSNAQGAVREPAIEIEPDRALECTPSGQVVTSLGGKRLFDLQRTELQRLMAGLAARRGSAEFRRSLAGRIRRRLALPESTTAPPVRPLGTIETGGLRVEKLLVESEPGIVIPTRMVRKKDPTGRLPVVLWIRDRDGGGDGADVFEQLARAGRLVAVVDVRGFGETRSPRNAADKRMGYYHPRDGMDADLSYAALSLGRPLLGMRVHDVLSALACLRARPDVDPARIVLSGRGWAALIAVFAAAIDPDSAAAAAEGVPASYAEILGAETWAQPVSQMLPGVLQDFDLEDVFALCAPRPVLVLNATNAETRRMTTEGGRRALAAVAHAYAAAGQSSKLAVQVAPTEAETSAALVDWLLRQ
jgi:cephalosporin-C deacetylase-like acetyl esterase